MALPIFWIVLLFVYFMCVNCHGFDQYLYRFGYLIGLVIFYALIVMVYILCNIIKLILGRVNCVTKSPN